jgi:hypothetical protein
MAKRLTDIAKWDKLWFRKLSPSHKCFWQYICDRCDFSGIWEVDFDTASHYIGEQIDQEEIKKVFSKQFIELNGGSRWLIKDFIIFQYGGFNETNKMYHPIKNNLDRYGVCMGDIWGINAVKDTVKDKDTVKVKDIGVVKGKFLEFVLLTEKEHLALIDIFGEITTNEYIQRLNDYIGSKGVKYKSHYHTILNWARKDKPQNIINLTKQQQSNLKQLEALNYDK